MPAPEVSSLPQKAVIWSYITDDDYGNIICAQPIEINCRWVGSIGEQLNPLTATIMDVSTTVVVDRAIAVKSLIWLGELANLLEPISNLNQVKNYNDTPDIKGRNFLKTVTVIRYRNSLPALIATTLPRFDSTHYTWDNGIVRWDSGA